MIGIGTSEIYLNWMDVQGETGYCVKRSLNGVNFTNPFTTGANHNGTNVVGLAAGTPYTFRITPLTTVGDGVTTPLIISTETRMAAVASLRFTASPPRR